MNLAKYIRVDDNNKVVSWTSSSDDWNRLEKQNTINVEQQTETGVDALTWKILPVETDLTGFIQAVHNPSDDTFTEDSATSTAVLDQAFVDYCECKKNDIDEMCADKFETHFIRTDLSPTVRRYLDTVHTLKGEVANAHWNANDKPAGDATRLPEAKKEDATDSTADYHFLLTRESTTRSLSMSDMVAVVKNLSNIQIGAFDDLEEIRSPNKDEIDIERDRETVPGTKDNDYAAVDTIVTAVQTALDAMTWTAV